MNMINFQIQIFLLALTGFVLGKRKVLDARTRGHLTDLILMAALPCSIIDSFQMTLSAQILMSTLSVLLISIAIQGLYWIWNRLFYRHEGIDRRICLKYATMVSNAGFIGMPVCAAVYGSLGLLYASIFLLPQRIFMWSYGLSMFTAVDGREVVKKVLTHPCIVSIFIGMAVMALYTYGIHLPAALQETISSLGACSTPLSMLLTGAILSEVNLRELFQRQVLLFSLYRLLILPLIVLAVLIVLPLDPLSMKVCVLLTAMPAANTTVMLAGKYDRDPAFASELVMTSTLLSLFTIPLISGLLSLI